MRLLGVPRIPHARRTTAIAVSAGLLHSSDTGGVVASSSWCVTDSMLLGRRLALAGKTKCEVWVLTHFGGVFQSLAALTGKDLSKLVTTEAVGSSDKQ